MWMVVILIFNVAARTSVQYIATRSLRQIPSFPFILWRARTLAFPSFAFCSMIFEFSITNFWCLNFPVCLFVLCSKLPHLSYYLQYSFYLFVWFVLCMSTFSRFWNLVLSLLSIIEFFAPVINSITFVNADFVVSE